MGVADIFTAIKEDRPYRKGMSDNKAKKIIGEMSENNYLDKNITSLLIDNFEEINITRKNKQNRAKKYDQEFRKSINFELR